jgi:hypothetical protein
MAVFRSRVSLPYRNPRTEVLRDDGSFARVLVWADLRPRADVDWTPYVVEYELVKVGGQWRTQSGSRAGHELEPASVRAARESAYRVAAAVSAEVVAIDILAKPAGVKEVQFTVRWSLPDGQPHRAHYDLNFEATGRGCVEPSFALKRDVRPEDVVLRLRPGTRIQPTPEPVKSLFSPGELIGAEPASTYAALVAYGNTTKSDCERITDPRDLQLKIRQLDQVAIPPRP